MLGVQGVLERFLEDLVCCYGIECPTMFTSFQGNGKLPRVSITVTSKDRKKPLDEGPYYSIGTTVYPSPELRQDELLMWFQALPEVFAEVRNGVTQDPHDGGVFFPESQCYVRFNQIRYSGLKQPLGLVHETEFLYLIARSLEKNLLSKEYEVGFDTVDTVRRHLVGFLLKVFPLCAIFEVVR